MWNSIGISIRTYVVALLVLGLAYPLAITGISQLVMNRQADGSLVINEHGDVVGSELIGQQFSSARYFHSRPSASGYDALASGGTNLGPTSRELADSVRARVSEARTLEAGLGARVPVDMVTTSASGLDPHISPSSALAQVARVAESRALEQDRVRQIVLEHVQRRDLGFIGEPRVNVLVLNRALDALQ